MTYLDVWRSGTFLLYGCKVAFCIQETSPRLSDVKCSVILQSLFAIGSALTCLLFFRECATLPQVKVHFMWLTDNDSYSYQAFSHISTASEKCQDEKAWVRWYQDLLVSCRVQNLENNSKYCPCKFYAQLSKQQGSVSCLKRWKHTQLTVEDTGSMVLNTVTSQKTTTRSTLISLFLSSSSSSDITYSTHWEHRC